MKGEGGEIAVANKAFRQNLPRNGCAVLMLTSSLLAHMHEDQPLITGLKKKVPLFKTTKQKTSLCSALGDEPSN